MKKKSIMVLVAVLVVLLLAACGKNETEERGKGNETKSDNNANVTLKVASPTATPAVKVNTPEEDRTIVAKIFGEAEKVAADVQWDLYPGTEFRCNIDNGSIMLEIRAFGTDTEQAVSEWYGKSGVENTQNNKMLSSEKAVGWKGSYEGTFTDDGTMYWKAVGIDPAADAVLFPEGFHRFDGEFVTIWHTATDMDYREEPLRKAVADFNSKHSDILLIPRGFANPYDLDDALRRAGESDMLPDIFEKTYGWSFLTELEQGWIHNLDDVYDHYKNDLPEAIADSVRIADKMYSIPYVCDCVVLYANMKLLREAGYTEIPATFEELEACCEKLVKAGVTPFLVETDENYFWSTVDFFETFLQKTIGPEKMEAIFRGLGSWEDPELLSAVNRFRGMIDQGYICLNTGLKIGDDGVVSGNATEAFTNGKCAFMVTGSWYATDMDRLNEDLTEEFALAQFPVVNPEVAKLNQYVAYLNYGFCVAEKGDRSNTTAETAFAFTKTLVGYLYADNAFYPVWRGEIVSPYVGPITRSMSDSILSADHLTRSGSVLVDPAVLGSYFNALRRMVDEGLSGEDFIKAVLTVY